MNKKELELRRKELLKELDKEKQKKKNAETKLSLYEYKEKQTTNKSKPKIDENQKHTIVDAIDFEGSYNYDQRRKDWHKKAGHNTEQLVCSSCKDDDNWETILLDDGRHICYYCWIKKPKTVSNKKVGAKKSSVKREAKPKIDENQKHTIVPVVDFEENYNYDLRRKEWHKKAGHNTEQLVCSCCKDDDNWETILLEDGRHICYYCWIKKPKTATTKKATTKKVSAKKSSVKREAKPKIDENQKHTIVPVVDFEENYNYDLRRKDWHKKAGHNTEQLVCSCCKDDDNWETILLEDGRHICYYCWIKKPKTATTKKAKSKVVSKNAPKVTENVVKRSSKEIIVVPVEVYENFNERNRFDQWYDAVNYDDKNITCDVCKAKEVHEYVLLDNGDNICYYCWIDNPKVSTKANKKQLAKATNNESVNYEVEEATDEGKPVGKLFWFIAITCGILLIALIIILSLGIISGNFDFKF